MPVVKKTAHASSLGNLTVFTNAEAMAVGHASANLEPHSLARDEPLWLPLPGLPEGTTGKVSGIGWPSGGPRPGTLRHMDRWGGAVLDPAADADEGGWHVELSLTQVRADGGTGIWAGNATRESTREGVEAALALPGVREGLMALAAELAAFMVSPKGTALRRSSAAKAVEKAALREQKLEAQLEAARAEREAEEALLGIVDAS